MVKGRGVPPLEFSLDIPPPKTSNLPISSTYHIYILENFYIPSILHYVLILHTTSIDMSILQMRATCYFMFLDLYLCIEPDHSHL